MGQSRVSFDESGIVRSLSQVIVVVVSILALSGCFPKKAGRELVHFDHLAPAIGDQAPAFSLTTINGGTISLDELVGEKPTVLQFGSHSCPVYRFRRFSMSTRYKKYSGQVNFLVVYTLEAHPAGSNSPYADKEWLTFWNRMDGVRITQATTIDQRRQQAKMSHELLSIYYPMAVDKFDNEVWTAYGAASSPAFLLDRNGKVVLRQVWLDPAGIDRALQRILKPEE